MTGLALFLLIIAIVFYILTRETYVYVNYDGNLSIEFHLVIFSLVLSEEEKEQNSFKPRLRFYYLLFKELSKLSEKSCIRIYSIRLARLKNLLSPKKIAQSYFYHAVIFTIIAYFNEKSKKLILNKNALTLIPDTVKSDVINIRLSTELYNIIIALVKILFHFNKNKKKGRVKNVGN